MAVRTTMFMLDNGNNLRLVGVWKPPAVLQLCSATFVVELHSINVGIDGDGSVVAGHAALIGHR